MFIAGKEYKIRSVLMYPDMLNFGASVFEDCLFDTFFRCLDHILDIRETIRENDLDGFLCIVGAERRRPTPDFCTSSHIVSELNRDWYTDDWFDANAERYKDCSIRFCLCEYIDGQTGADGAYWEKDYGRIGMRDICNAVDEEAADIFRQKFRHIRPEKPVVYRGMSGYAGKPVGEDQTLVCDACYYPIDECTCEEKGLGAVPIDTKYVPIIRELNKKGYCTKFCCAGHEEQFATGQFSPDIMFEYENDFAVPLPEEYVYFRKSCHIFLRSDLPLPDGSDIESARAFHDRITDDLAEWVHKLPTVAKVEYREYKSPFMS